MYITLSFIPPQVRKNQMPKEKGGEGGIKTPTRIFFSMPEISACDAHSTNAAS